VVCAEASLERSLERLQASSQLKVATGSRGWGQFGNPKEGEHPPLEATAK
jgi:hypothetical protein